MIKIYKQHPVLLILVFLLFGSFLNAYEDISKLKGPELAAKLFSKLQVSSYFLSIEFTNSAGDVRHIKTYFKAPDLIKENMIVTYSKNDALKEESLNIVCDGEYLWSLITGPDTKYFQFVEMKKVKSEGISTDDFFMNYSMGSIHAYSKIYRSDAVVPDSWEITGKKEIDGKDCWETHFTYKKFANEKDKFRTLFIGCEDGLPRPIGIRVLSFTPFAPLTKTDFTFIPPKEIVPKNTTDLAIENYYRVKKQKDKTEETLKVLNAAGTPESGKSEEITNAPDSAKAQKPGSVKEPDKNSDSKKTVPQANKGK